MGGGGGRGGKGGKMRRGGGEDGQWGVVGGGLSETIQHAAR